MHTSIGIRADVDIKNFAILMKCSLGFQDDFTARTYKQHASETI